MEQEQQKKSQVSLEAIEGAIFLADNGSGQESESIITILSNGWAHGGTNFYTGFFGPPSGEKKFSDQDIPSEIVSKLGASQAKIILSTAKKSAKRKDNPAIEFDRTTWSIVGVENQIGGAVVPVAQDGFADAALSLLKLVRPVSLDSTAFNPNFLSYCLTSIHKVLRGRSEKEFYHVKILYGETNGKKLAVIFGASENGTCLVALAPVNVPDEFKYKFQLGREVF